MALLWLSCPHCRVFFHIDDANAGKQVACRACGNPIRIPGGGPKSAVWYYTRDRKPLGPVTFEQLGELARTGILAPQELVWQEGMPQWMEARSVDGLYPTPPPLPVAAPAKPEEPPQPIEEEPDIEIVAEESSEPPIPLASEPDPVAPSWATPVEALPETVSSQSLPRLWDPQKDSLTATEEPIQVEPEFTLDFAAAPTPPIRRVDPPPTVDLVFPTDLAVDPLPMPPDIELTPIEPKMELVEPEDTGPATPYRMGAGSNQSRSREVVAVPEAPVSDPETYPVAGVAHPVVAEVLPVAIPVAAEAIAATPMAIPVPPVEKPYREETEIERRNRLRREYLRAKNEWTSVRKGLNIVYIAAAIWFTLFGGRIIINAAISIITGEGMSATEQSDSGAGVSIVILFIMAIGVDSLAILGLIQCLRVPESTGARVVTVAALVVTGLEIFCVLLTPFATVMVFIALAAGFCRWFAFVFFLQTVNHFFEAHLNMKSIERLLLLMGMTTGIAVLLWLGMAYLVQVFAKGEKDTAAEITKILASLCTSVPLLALTGLCTIRYLRALRDTVALIDERLYRGEIG